MVDITGVRLATGNGWIEYSYLQFFGILLWIGVTLVLVIYLLLLFNRQARNINKRLWKNLWWYKIVIIITVLFWIAVGLGVAYPFIKFWMFSSGLLT